MRSSSVQRVVHPGQHLANAVSAPQRDPNQRDIPAPIGHQPPRNSVRQSVRSVWSNVHGPRGLRRASVASGVDLKQVAMMYDVFLRIRTDNADIKSLQRPLNELTQDYQEYKINNCNLALTLVVSFLLAIYIIVGIFTTSEAFYSPSADPFVTLAASFGIACVVILVITAIHRFFVLTEYTHPIAAPLKRLCQVLSQSPLTVRLLSDSLPVLLALRSGFAIFSRVGRNCDSGRLNFPIHLYDCLPNEEGGQQGLPAAIYAFCLYVVLLEQKFIKGASRTAVCLSW